MDKKVGETVVNPSRLKEFARKVVIEGIEKLVSIKNSYA